MAHPHSDQIHDDGLVIRGLSKTYPGQVALDNVDLHLRPGHVHALLGQNGSGKSTLIKILAGYHSPDPGGSAWLNGEPITLGSQSAARSAGMRFIHQDLGLVPDMSVVDNLALGQQYTRKWWLSDRAEVATARQRLAEFDLDVDPTIPLRALSPAQRTVVAVARALRGEASDTTVLVLDEPSANLPEHEVQMLFTAVRRARDRGVAVLYVTHRLQEVFALADTVTVLRDGQRIVSVPVQETNSADLVAHIAGRPLEQLYPSPPSPQDEVALDVRQLHGHDIRGVSFVLHKGEILGIAGISGSGRDTLNQLLFGSLNSSSGEIRTATEVFERLAPPDAIAAGIAFLPADRKCLSAIPAFTVRENLTLPRLTGRTLSWLSLRAESSETDRWLERLQVTPAEPDRVFASLSGGNQQKVVLARWLRCESQVLLLDEPTQGVDVGGKHAIYEALGRAARQGAAILVASSDAEELAEICDRVLVLRGGRVDAELDGAALSANTIVAETVREQSVG